MWVKYQCSQCETFVVAPEGADPGGRDCLERGCGGVFQVCVYKSGRREGQVVMLVGRSGNREYSELAHSVKKRARAPGRAWATDADDDPDDDSNPRPGRRPAVRADNDTEYVAAASHHPGQRYTVDSYAGGMAPSSHTVATRFRWAKPTALHRITARAKTGGQKAAMGQVSAVEQSATAFRHLPEPKLAAVGNGFEPAAEEWCHLVAACLGGQIEAKSLVAGSFSCNTYMYEIENYLTGRTDLAVRVTAYGRAPRVADWMRYELFKVFEGGLGKPVVTRACEFWINANATGFSKTDGERVRKELKTLVPSPKLWAH